MKLKLNPLPDSIRGKRLVVVDDSIVRGTTTRQIVAMLREAGAAEVHIRITCPPIRWPCFYGIDMSTRAELVAADLAVEEIRRTSAPTRSATSRSSGWCGRPGSRRTTSAGRASTASTRSRSRSTPASSCWRTSSGSHGVSGAYRDAGVDTEAAAKAVALIADLAADVRRPEVADRVGGFAGLYRIGDGRLLAAATDGVGTKLEIARRRAGWTPSGSTSWRCAPTTSSAPAPSRCSSSTTSRWARSSRPGGLDRRGRGRGVPPGRVRAARRGDRRAPRRDGGGRVRPRGVLRGRGGRGVAARSRSRGGGRRPGRPRVERPARERLLARALGGPGPVRPRGHAAGAGPAARRRAPRALRDLRARRGGARARRAAPRGGPRHRRRDRREPPAGAPRRVWGADVARGSWPEPPIFRVVQDVGRRIRTTTCSRPSTWGSGWCWSCAPDQASDVLGRSAHEAFRIGEVTADPGVRLV